MTPDLVIKLAINDAVLEGTAVESQTFYARGLPWKLCVCTERSQRTGNVRVLSVYTYCNWESEERDWSCNYTTIFVLINKNDADTYYAEPFSHVAQHDHSHKGYCQFLKWRDVIDENKGFLVDGRITVKAHISVTSISGMRRSNPMDFTKHIDMFTDVALVVDNKRLHVSKQFLSLHSPFFAAMFFGKFVEKEKQEVEINEVKYDHFVDFLNVLYPTSTEILARTVPHILALADRYQVESVLEKAETYLLGTDKFKTEAKLKFADQFRLNRLRIRCLKSYKTTDQLFKFKGTPEFEAFSNDMKAAICERLMELYVK